MGGAVGVGGGYIVHGGEAVFGMLNFSLSKCHKCFSCAFLHATRCVDHRGPCES